MLTIETESIITHTVLISHELGKSDISIFCMHTNQVSELLNAEDQEWTMGRE